MLISRHVACLFAFFLVHVPGPTTRAGEEPPKSAELKVLEQLVGKWDSEVVLKPAEWTPKEVRSKGTLTREWALKGRFVQEKGGSAENPAICMFTYDSQKKPTAFGYSTRRAAPSNRHANGTKGRRP